MNTRLSIDAQAQALNMLSAGFNATEISDDLGIPRTTLRAFFKEAGKETVYCERWGIDDLPETRPSGILSAVRPLSVSIPKPAARLVQEGKPYTGLFYGDNHYPHNDEATTQIVAAITADLQPDVLVNVGDLLDAYELSRFDKNPERKHSIQDEIDMARQHLASMRLIAPNAIFTLIEGNHEDRLRRLLWNLPGEAKVLSNITAFRQTLTWPSLLGLEDMHITHVPYGQEQHHNIFPGMMVKHGHIVRQKSGYSAHGEYDRWRISGASGHTHRLAVYYHDRDVWMETGCCCKLQATYTPYCNWQNGFMVVTRTPTGSIAVEPIQVRNEEASFRGNIYRASL